MDELNDLAKKTFYLAFGVASHVAQEAEKNLNELGIQAQKVLNETEELIEDAIARGEAEVNGWNMSPKSQPSNNSEPSPPSPQLKRQLYRLIGGDMELADRLLTKVRQKHPNQSEDWYWEKVIYDLERDRQNY